MELPERPVDENHREEVKPMSLEERAVEVSAAMMELIRESSGETLPPSLLPSLSLFLSLPDSPEEGELYLPKEIRDIPDAPPPEGSWPPCLRVVVKDSSALEKGTVIVITAHDGAEIGR